MSCTHLSLSPVVKKNISSQISLMLPLRGALYFNNCKHTIRSLSSNSKSLAYCRVARLGRCLGSGSPASISSAAFADLYSAGSSLPSHSSFAFCSCKFPDMNLLEQPVQGHADHWRGKCSKLKRGTWNKTLKHLTTT